MDRTHRLSDRPTSPPAKKNSTSARTPPAGSPPTFATTTTAKSEAGPGRSTLQPDDGQRLLDVLYGRRASRLHGRQQRLGLLPLRRRRQPGGRREPRRRSSLRGFAGCDRGLRRLAGRPLLDGARHNRTGEARPQAASPPARAAPPARQGPSGAGRGAAGAGRSTSARRPAGTTRRGWRGGILQPGEPPRRIGPGDDRPAWCARGVQRRQPQLGLGLVDQQGADCLEAPAGRRRPLRPQRGTSQRCAGPLPSPRTKPPQRSSPTSNERTAASQGRRRLLPKFSVKPATA